MRTEALRSPANKNLFLIVGLSTILGAVLGAAAVSYALTFLLTVNRH